MSTAIESGIGTINYGKQAAKGTKAVAATTTVGFNRAKLFDGALKVNKVKASEEYVDGNRWASPSQFTDKVAGEVGSLVIQAQPENVGLYFAQILGVDTVTGGSDPYTHTITSAGTSGAWGSWWQSAGASIGPVKEMFWDSKIKKLAWQCGQDQNVAHLSLDILAINAGEIYSTAPAKTEDTSDPLLWTEITGSVSFDGTTLGEVTEETLDADTQMEAFYGDDIKPAQLIEKKGTLVTGIKSIITDSTLPLFYKGIYGTASPVAGNLPVKAQYYAVLNTLYTRSATRTLAIQRPNVAVDAADMMIAPQREGGEIPIAFAGDCLKSGATPALTVIVLSGEALSYA